MRTRKVICGIYKITNILNNKCYVGQSINIYQRWKAHKKANDSMAIHNAINKYGLNNFTFEILEECDANMLSDREIYWISYYDSYKNGYNATLGGDGASHPVKLSKENLILLLDDLKNSNKSIQELSNLYGVSCNTIMSVNNGTSRIQQNTSYPIREFDNISTNKIDNIDKNDLYSYLIKTKGDFSLAGERFNCSSMTIRAFCKKYNLPILRKDYGWIDEQAYHSIKVIQRDIVTNEIIKIYNSCREASRALNVNHNTIGKALSSKSHISCGYYWEKV